MPTRPPSPDPAGSSPADAQNPFATFGAGLGAGLDFFQDWLKAAGSALPNMPGAPAASGTAPAMSAWTMPTLDPAELEKRIQDLKTVQFWLEQNARMVAMTIQGLEVQRMTLSTLKGMNVSMDALRDSLKARAETPSPAAATSPFKSREESSTSGSDDAPDAAKTESASNATPEASDLINPMRWWDTLTQQFTHLASQAAQTVNESVGESVDMLKQAQSQAAKATRAAARGASAASGANADTGAGAGKPSRAKAAAPRKATSRPRTKAGAGTKTTSTKAPEA